MKPALCRLYRRTFVPYSLLRVQKFLSGVAEVCILVLLYFRYQEATVKRMTSVQAIRKLVNSYSGKPEVGCAYWCGRLLSTGRLLVRQNSDAAVTSWLTSSTSSTVRRAGVMT